MDKKNLIPALLDKTKLSRSQLAQLLGTSEITIYRWENLISEPNESQMEIINVLINYGNNPSLVKDLLKDKYNIFAGRNKSPRRANSGTLNIFNYQEEIKWCEEPLPPIIGRLNNGGFFSSSNSLLVEILNLHKIPAITATKAMEARTISAGKNTYVYDAHTYHTKVPPQGITEIIKHYLPNGGLVFDPFAGSGMTGVASLANGFDCILNELSPAACFISNRFTSKIDPDLFNRAVDEIMRKLENIRTSLYTTHCRECGKVTELLYTVWSYKVVCYKCEKEFLLWDHCRKYGKTVKEHKILSEFPCPHCKGIVKKSRLSRTSYHPVFVGYKCCSRKQMEAPLDQYDLKKLASIESAPPVIGGFYPTNKLPNGVNLGQPINHGIDSVDKFYSPRNLAALSHLWKAIHTVENTNLAGYLAFVFTSLYQRVTKLSEFRFWGGSGNTARFNVPYIFNEANVFSTFERKANSIFDFLATTARHYKGQSMVAINSATNLNYLPANSIDFIFTDPPFGGNINYSEMNILWESWLGTFTNSKDEAIINRVQNKNVEDYEILMKQSLLEAYRVLRPGHWMVLVFNNSSKEVWVAIVNAIKQAGFAIENINIFDKEHGTFKQYVSDNAANFDLVLHCLKQDKPSSPSKLEDPTSHTDTVIKFLEKRKSSLPKNIFLHVEREDELDIRKLYSEWLSETLINTNDILDLNEFRFIVLTWIRSKL